MNSKRLSMRLRKRKIKRYKKRAIQKRKLDVLKRH